MLIFLNTSFFYIAANRQAEYQGTCISSSFFGGL